MSSSREPREPFTKSLIFQIAAAFLASAAATLFLGWAGAEWGARDEGREWRGPRPARMFRALLLEQLGSPERDDPEAWRSIAERFRGTRLRVERGGILLYGNFAPAVTPDQFARDSDEVETETSCAPDGREPAPCGTLETGTPAATRRRAPSSASAGEQKIRLIERDGFRILYAAPPFRKPFHPFHPASAFLFMSFATFLFLFLYMRRVLAPLREMIRVTRAVSRGDLTARLPKARTREFDILFRSFNDMTAKLQAVLANHRLMLGNLSHDLKHHLGRMRLSVELDVPDAAARQSLEEEIAAIDGYLDRTREAIRAVDGRALHRPEERDLSELVRDLCAEAKIPAEVAPGIRAALDPMFFPVLLRNLLDNAAKHGTAPAARLAAAEGLFTIEVANLPHAPLPAEELELLFQPYYRGDHARSKVQGSGLGLFIVRGIADAHGFDTRLSLDAAGRFLATLTGPVL